MPQNLQPDEDGNLPGYTRVVPQTPPVNFNPGQSLDPPRDSTARFNASPIPGITFSSPDQLRGFHLGGKIPQYRTILPAQNNNSGGGSGTSSSIIIAGGGTSTTGNLGIIQSATFSIPILAPGGVYTGSLGLNGEGWNFFTLSCSYAMRVRAYGTAISQTTDLTRPITQGPGFATQQDIIFDVNLDTLPAQWDFQDVSGNNNDEGESQLIYLTITNNSVSSTAGTATLQYAAISGFAGQL